MFATPCLGNVLLRVCSVDLEDCFWSQVWAHVSRGWLSEQELPVLGASKSPMEVEEDEKVRGRRMTCGPTELSLVKIVLWAM
ncbi:hypothetical protein YC2023_060656 [Brassica napus]